MSMDKIQITPDVAALMNKAQVAYASISKLHIDPGGAIIDRLVAARIMELAPDDIVVHGNTYIKATR